MIRPHDSFGNRGLASSCGFLERVPCVSVVYFCFPVCVIWCAFSPCVRFLLGRRAALCHVVVSQELEAKCGDGAVDSGKPEKYMIITTPH